MIWVAIGLSVVLLALTNLIACRYTNLGRASLLAWGFAVLGLVPFVLPTVLVQATLLALVGTGCLVTGLGAKVFLKGSILTTVLAYLAIGAASVWSAGRDATVPECWAAAAHMHDGTVADYGQWSRPWEAFRSPSREEVTPFDREIHHNTVTAFESVFDFGSGRMIRLASMHHRAPVPPPPVTEIEATGLPFGFTPDTVSLQREYVDTAGGHWELTQVQLVGLLKHDGPVAYRTHEPPNMDAGLNAVPVRPLDEWESVQLIGLKNGQELIVERKTGAVRMFGAIRAAEKCQLCHQANPGDLLGAFSYDLRRKD